jgi:coenzyme F420-reducing hydrogenase gamma subunit
MERKLKIGWFTFTCCEDSTIIFTELMNTHWREWRESLEFVHAKTIQSKNELREMDVAFVEGAISSNVQEEKLKKIRALSKKIVAIGACACTGLPATQRNTFDGPTKGEINDLLIHFNHADRVRTIADVVPVDAKVHGCPMTEQQFLMILNKYLKEFEVT